MIKNINLSTYNRYTINSENVLWPLFFIWPFMAFLLALANYKYRTSKIIVYLFLVLYGLTYVISNVGVDSYEYSLKLIANANRPFSDFWASIVGQYAYDTSVDIVEPFISFMVSRVTHNHYLLFGAFAAIFGLFFLKSVNNLYSRYIENPGIALLVFLIFFALINPIFNINGFRFYTAGWIFFYGASNFILKKEKKYIIIALSSVLVHFSFASAGIVLLAYFIAGNRNLIYIPLLILSFAIPNLLYPYLIRLAPSLGSSIQNRVEGYTNVDYILTLAESSASLNWFMKAESYVLYFVLFAIVFLKLSHKEVAEKPESANLFSFLLLFLSFVNFGKSIPSVGRFQNIFLLFGILYIFIILSGIPNTKRYLITLAGLVPMALMSGIALRIGMDTVNVRLFEPFIFLFSGEDISLWSLLFT